MGVSHHSEDYDLMKVDFREYIRAYFLAPQTPDDYENLVDGLFSIMNDYGAVQWT